MSDVHNGITIALIGAGGKMGMRITNNLLNKGYRLLLCEKGEEGINRIREKGLTACETEEAVPVSHYIIMAVPDAKLEKISQSVVPLMKENAAMIILDPAAAYAGRIALRDDCTFVVTHPCHPPLFGVQETPEARDDLFGGIAAKQDIVIAQVKGSEDCFIKAKEICMKMFAPVVNCHVITVEQMAILEPAAAEVVIATAACIMKEAVEEAIRLGVPEKAAKSFLLGHIQIALAILFKSSNPFSDAAKIAIEYGRKSLFQRDWKKVFKKENINEVLNLMLDPNTEI